MLGDGDRRRRSRKAKLKQIDNDNTKQTQRLAQSANGGSKIPGTGIPGAVVKITAGTSNITHYDDLTLQRSYAMLTCRSITRHYTLHTLLEQSCTLSKF